MLKRIFSVFLGVALIGTLSTQTAFATTTEKTMTLDENWRLSSVLDLSVDTIVTIDGKGQFEIFEMTDAAKFTNTGLGKVTLKDTNLYSFNIPSANSLGELSEKFRAAALALGTVSVTGETAFAKTYLLTKATQAVNSSSYAVEISTFVYDATTKVWSGQLEVTHNGNKAIKTNATGSLTITPPTVVVGGGGGGGGGGNTPTPTAAPTPSSAPSTAAVNSHVAVIETKVVTEVKDGIATANVKPADVAQAITAAQETLAKDSTQVIAIELSVNVPETAKSSEISVGAEVLASIDKLPHTEIIFNLGTTGTFTIDKDIINTLTHAANDSGLPIKLVSEKIETTTLSQTVREAVGDSPVFDFGITVGNKSISELGGKINISIPFNLGQKNPDAMSVFYISPNGKLSYVMGKYSATEKAMKMETSHFSQYALRYNPQTFNDMGASYAKPAVDFLSAREITTGVGDRNFAPTSKIKRAEFLVMLMRAYAIDVSAAPTDNFADSLNSYYSPYLAVAKQMGLSTGVDGVNFNPQQEISREQMFTLVYRVLDKLGKLPKAPAASPSFASFADSQKVGATYQNEIKTLVERGVVQGSGGYIYPKDSAQRQEMAQIIYNLLK